MCCLPGFFIAEMLNCSAIKNDWMTETKQLANYNYITGYQQGRSVNKAQSQKIDTIGVIVHHLESYFTGSALKGIREIANRAGFEVIIANSQGSIKKEVANARLLFNSGVTGVIASLYPGTNKLLHFDAFKKLGIPVVFFDRAENNSQNDAIVIDNSGCGFEAAEHLIKQGCKRIAMVTCGLDKNVNIQCYKGYRAALEKYDMPFTPELLVTGGKDKNAAVKTAMHIMQMQPRPDGLFFTNDLEAAGCMQALKEAGIGIPEDIAIVGFDNNPISRLVSPALTTIDYPGYEAGKAAAAGLLSHLTGKQAPGQGKTTVIPARLIVRNSSLKKSRAIA